MILEQGTCRNNLWWAREGVGGPLLILIRNKQDPSLLPPKLAFYMDD